MKIFICVYGHMKNVFASINQARIPSIGAQQISYPVKTPMSFGQTVHQGYACHLGIMECELLSPWRYNVGFIKVELVPFPPSLR